MNEEEAWKLASFLNRAGIDINEAETLIRLAVCTVVDGYEVALDSFSDPDEVEELARTVEARLYPVSVAERERHH